MQGHTMMDVMADAVMSLFVRALKCGVNERMGE